MVGIIPVLWFFVLLEVLVHMTFEPNDGIWISDIHRVRIPQLCALYWACLLSQGCSSKIYMYIRAASSYSLWYLVSEVNVNLILICICWNHRFLYLKVASFSRKILLKLIIKSCNSGVTWSRFKYFPLLATFAAKLIHFCTSYWRFSLYLTHTELQ